MFNFTIRFINTYCLVRIYFLVFMYASKCLVIISYYSDVSVFHFVFV